MVLRTLRGSREGSVDGLHTIQGVSGQRAREISPLLLDAHREEYRKKHVKVAILPDIPYPYEREDFESRNTLRELDLSPNDYRESDGGRPFSYIEQGYVYRVDAINTVDPYLYLTMSQCSAVIGKNGNELVTQTDAALEYMQQLGIDIADIRVVASVADDDKYADAWPSPKPKNSQHGRLYRSRY